MLRNTTAIRFTPNKQGGGPRDGIVLGREGFFSGRG